MEGTLPHGKHADGAGECRIGIVADQGVFHLARVFGAHNDGSGSGGRQLRSIPGIGQKAQFRGACLIQRVHAGNDDIVALKAKPQSFGNAGKRIACHGGSFADSRRAGRVRKQGGPGRARPAPRFAAEALLHVELAALLLPDFVGFGEHALAHIDAFTGERRD